VQRRAPPTVPQSEAARCAGGVRAWGLSIFRRFPPTSENSRLLEAMASHAAADAVRRTPMMRACSADGDATPERQSATTVRRLLLNHVFIAHRLRSQMRQAHLSVCGEGRLVSEGVFAKIAERIDAIAVLLMQRAVLCGAAPAQDRGVKGAAPALSAYPLGVADEHAHAFAASCALAIVAQAARDDAGAARALGDPAHESLFNEIARRVEAEIWVVQQSLDPPVDTA